MEASTAGSLASASVKRRARSAETSGDASVFGMVLAKPRLDYRPKNLLRCYVDVLRLRRPAVVCRRLATGGLTLRHHCFGRIGQRIVRMPAIALEEGA